MHASSMENMRRCFQRHVDDAFLASRPGPTCRVLDIGGTDVNGSYRDLLDERFTYRAADLDDAPGVAVVLDDPYRIPLPDGSVDIVLSGQMLEHCEFFWLQFQEMMRVLRDDGYLFLIAPSSGVIHRFPVDCYRFHPDAYTALARLAGCHLADMWHDDRGPWRDLVGVFRHSPDARAPRGGGIELGQPAAAAPPQPDLDSPEEQVAGTMDYLHVLDAIHATLAPRRYVEIGVRHGMSLRLAQCPAIGVDPFPELTVDLAPDCEVIPMASDAYFDTGAPGFDDPVDLAFIDGMHLAEFGLRDFMNLERRMPSTGVIVIDDVIPSHPVQGRRARSTAVWTGDVWKLLQALRDLRPDLTILPIDSRPAGMAVVVALDQANRTLHDQYNPLVRTMLEDQEVPEAVTDRQGAHTDLAALRMVLLTLRSLRPDTPSTGVVRRRVRDVLATAAPDLAAQR